MTISSKEIEYYKKIRDNCRIVFDIGCREDIHYIELSENKIFHLFEPNPEYHANIAEKIKNINNNKIYLNNFGLGNSRGIKDYYKSTESFYKRFHLINLTDLPIHLLMEKFSVYLQKNEIKRIDFLKMDVEGGEPDILLDIPRFVKNKVKYVQFEWASAWIDRGDDIKLQNIFDIYSKYFYFYYLNEGENPISRGKDPSILMEKIIDHAQIKEMDENYMRQGMGFNIIMEKKNVSI